MPIAPEGIQAAADREKQFHPTPANSKTPITAWQRRADTLKDVVEELNHVSAELTALKGAILQRPF